MHKLIIDVVHKYDKTKVRSEEREFASIYNLERKKLQIQNSETYCASNEKVEFKVIKQGEKSE